MKNIWNKAAIDGLMLAAASIILVLVSELIGNAIVGKAIWIVKLVATVWLLWFFMSKYSEEHASQEGYTTRSQAVKYGFITSFLSAILVAVFTFINYKIMLTPETLDAMKEAYFSSGNLSSLDDDSKALLEKVLYHFPEWALVGQLIWCTLFGLIASAIMGGSVKIDNSDNAPSDDFTGAAI